MFASRSVIAGDCPNPHNQSSNSEHENSALFKALLGVVSCPGSDEEKQLTEFKKTLLRLRGGECLFVMEYRDSTRGIDTFEYEKLLDIIYEQANPINIGIACEFYSRYNRKPLLVAERRQLAAREHCSEWEAASSVDRARCRYDTYARILEEATRDIDTLAARPCYEEEYIRNKSKQNGELTQESEEFTQKIFAAFTRISLQPVIDQAYTAMFGKVIAEIKKQIDRLNVNSESFFAIKMGYKARLITTALNAAEKYCEGQLMEVAQQEFKKGNLRDRDSQDSHIVTTTEKSNSLIEVVEAKIKGDPNAPLSLNAALDYKADGQEFSLREALNFQRLFSFGSKAKSLEEIEEQVNKPTV